MGVDVASPTSPMSAENHGDDPAFEPDTRVQVRNKFDGRWATGFEVIAATGDGYRIRRLSDGGELPLLFAPGDLRAEKERRRSGTWWY